MSAFPKIKPLHGFGQPPFRMDFSPIRRWLTPAGIPFSRLHAVGGFFGGNLFVDIPNLFRDFEALEEVSFNDVNTMAGASFEYMFRNCTNLKSVDFGNADFSNVTTYGWMFANAQKLERVSFGETATTSATSMQSMFSQVFNLRYLYLGKNFTLPAIVTNMFNGTASVTTTVQDEEGHGLQCKLHASQALWDSLNTDLNVDGVNTTTGFNKNRFYFTPVD